MNKLNLYNFLAGFLTINIINMLAVGGFRIDSFQYRVFSVSVSFLLVIFLLAKRFWLIKSLWESKTFKLYLIFSFIYLSRLFFDRIFFDIKLPESPGVIMEMFISFTYIIIIPLSLINIVFIDQHKFQKNFFLIYSCLFIINSILNPVVFGEVNERMSTLANLGAQSLGISASVLFVWSTLMFFEVSKNIPKPILLPMIFVSLFYVAISGTRSVLLGSLLVIILFIFQNKKTLLTKKILPVSVFIGLLILTMPIWESWLEMTFLRVRYVFETGSTGRQHIWKKAIQMFIDSPLWGNHHVVPNEAYFHNFFLDAFVSTGFFGGLIFFVLNLKVLKISFKWLKIHSCWTNRFYSIFFILVFVFGLFSGNLYSSPTYWGAMMIIIVYSKIIEKPTLVKA